MATAAGRPLKVGLHMPHWEGGIDGVTPRWTDLLALARQAEAVGFDSLWVADHTWTVLTASSTRGSAVPSHRRSPTCHRSACGKAGRC